VLQQVTGINVFLYYGPEIFKNLGDGTNAALLQTVIVGAVNLTFTIAAILVVDRLGRKPLMILGSAGMGVSLAFLGLAAYLQRTEVWVLTFMLTYIASFAIAIGPVTWVLLSEIFPTKVRGRAMAIATLLLWLANFVVSQTFPMLDESPFLVATFHHGFAFWLYGAMCVVLIIVVWRWVPETKGKTLEEIEQYWMTRSR
jgi:MFS transporter, SP family, xylose:H+ symportor